MAPLRLLNKFNELESPLKSTLSPVTNLRNIFNPFVSNKSCLNLTFEIAFPPTP